MFLLFTTKQSNAQAPPTPRDTTIKGPQTFAMIMGISEYKYVRPLSFADKDAEMFANFLKSPAGGSLTDDNIYMLLNEDATAANFYSKGFQWLKVKKLQEGDRLFIYLSGHGDAISEDEFFYLAYDCNPAGDKNNYLAGGTIQMLNVKIKIQRETAKGVEVFLVMDACRTGELPGGTEGQSFFNEAISQKKVGEIIMLASQAGQESLEDRTIGNGHGLFTYFLVDGLNGLADKEGNADNKVSVEEIQKYVQKNVPSIAQEKFKRKQNPYFCCSENSTKIVSIVDPVYLKKWQEMKLQHAGGGNSFNGLNKKVRRFTLADTLLLESYNLFNAAVRESRLTGKNSAEYYYDLMAKKFPDNSYTIDAQSTLAVEFINFAQSKINLYLDCKDPASIQKLRAQIDEEDKADEISSSLDRMEKVSRQEFYEVGKMLERAISFIMPDDPDFAKSLEGRMYFFKARGYFGAGRRQVDTKQAFQYAYIAKDAEKNAAYVMHTLSSLHLDNNRLDSAIFYAYKAIATAPKWRYPYVTLAFAYKTLNKSDSAIKYYYKAIELNPENADAYVDLGHYYYSLSKGDSAIAYYEKALRFEPDNPYASNNIGWVNFSRKNFDVAINYFKKSIAANPTFINAYNGLSKTFFETKQFDSARIYYEKAFANYKDKSIVNVYIGNFYKELKELDSAKFYYRMAAGLDPNYEEAFNLLGKTSFELKQMDSAKYYYRRALIANPYSAFAFINLGLVHKELKNLDSTYYFFQQAIRMEPGNPSILNNLGVIYGQDKLYDSAKNYFQRALKVRPDYKPASNNLIRIYRQLNQLDSITNFIKGSSLIEKTSAGYFNEMGTVFLDQKRYDSARKYYRFAINVEPQNPQAYNNMGLAMQGLKRYDSARFYIRQAINLDGKNPIYWTNIAGVFKQLDMFDSATYYYKKLVFSRTDATAQAFFTVASYLNDLKEYDSAIVYFKKVIQLENRNAPAYSNICAAFIQLEKYDSAVGYGQKAVQLDPQYESGTLNLALAFRSVGQYDSAIVHFLNLIKLDVKKPRNYFRLACVYALKNQHEQAILYLKQSYERGYKNLDALLNDPDLIGLRNFKGYQDLLDKYIPDWRNR